MPRRLISSGSSFEREIGSSRAALVGDRVLVSGTEGFDHATTTIPDDIGAQTSQCLRNIEAKLADPCMKIEIEVAYGHPPQFARRIARSPPPTAPLPLRSAAQSAGQSPHAASRAARSSPPTVPSPVMSPTHGKRLT